MNNNTYKIMHMNDSLDMGGAEVMILELLKHIDRDKYLPHVCSLSKNGTLNEEFVKAGIPVFEVPQTPGLDYKSIFKIANVLRSNNIDILHTHNFTAWLYGSLATLLVRKCKLVHTQHSNIRLNKIPPKPLRRFLSWISRSVVTVSDQVAEDMLDLGYAQKNKFSVIYNGVDIPQPHDKNNGDELIHIGIVARLAQVKNHKLLLNAFSQNLKQHSNIFLDIVGDGPEKDNLIKQIDDLGIGLHVKLWGEVNNAKQCMSLFDIYVLSSYSEGLSISILEAMSYGLPIIATRVGGNQKLVTENCNGLLAESNNIESLSACFSTLIDNKETRIAMGKESLKLINNKFSITKMVDNYQAIYLKILN